MAKPLVLRTDSERGGSRSHSPTLPSTRSRKSSSRIESAHRVRIFQHHALDHVSFENQHDNAASENRTMSNAAVLSLESNDKTASLSAAPIAVFVMSLSSLLLELGLTRLFSVILFYHFAFLAISIALLGLGAGGVFAYLKKAWLAQWTTRQIGVATTLLNAVAIVVALIIFLNTRDSLELSIRNFFKLTEIYLLSAVPFFGTGLMFSVIFARETWRVGSLYAADLIGGSAACLLIVPLLNLVGGPNAVLSAAFLMVLSCVAWAEARRMR